MLTEADMGVTQMAMDSSANARFAGDEHLLVRFVMHPKMNQTLSESEGRPIYEEVPYIEIVQPGNKDSIVKRPATEADKQRFAEHYRKFQAREDEDATLQGTLLEEWPGVSRAQCEELRFFNVRTVEQLANLSDTNAQNLMGINILKQKAQNYLEDADTNAAKQALADAKAENAELREQMMELADRLNALEEEPEAPRKRGRPKKED